MVTSWTEQHTDGVGEYAIAVSATVRVLGSSYLGVTSMGSEYSLLGVPTGVNYSYPLIANAAFWDGGTDGVFNYSVDYHNGGVYRFNADWTNPQLLFATPPDYLGITFDASTNTLWISAFHTGSVEHRMLNGSLISFFTVPFTSISCLALDPADHTLWMGHRPMRGLFINTPKPGCNLAP